MNDLHPDFVRKVKELIKQFKVNINEYYQLLTGNKYFNQEQKALDICHAKMQFRLPALAQLRAHLAVNCDLRVFHPYDGYEKLDFKEITAT